MVEYAEVLSEKYGQFTVQAFFQFLEASPDVVFVFKYFFWNLIQVDLDDNEFVDYAFAANANFIFYDDRHFRVL